MRAGVITDAAEPENNPAGGGKKSTKKGVEERGIKRGEEELKKVERGEERKRGKK